MADGMDSLETETVRVMQLVQETVAGVVNSAPGSRCTVFVGGLRETVMSSFTCGVEVRDPDSNLVDRVVVEVGYSFQAGFNFRYKLTYQDADPPFRYFDSPQPMVDAINSHLAIFVYTPAQE